VKAQVKFSPRPTVIPPDLFDKFNQMSFWNDKAGSTANVIAVQGTQPGATS
jgi:sulfotransferase